MPTLPFLDSVRVVDLDEILPAWKGLGKHEVERKVLAHVLSDAGSGEEFPGALERPPVLRSSADEPKGTLTGNKFGRRGLLFLLGACAAAAGVIILAGEARSLAAATTAPLSTRFIEGLVLFIAGIGAALSATAGPMLRRRWIIRELGDIAARESSGYGRKGRGTRFAVRGIVFLVGLFFVMSGAGAILTGIRELLVGREHLSQMIPQFAFGLLLLAVGTGISLSVTVIPEVMRKREERAKLQYPNAPWMQWNREWAAGRMVKTPTLVTAIGFLVAGVLWNALIYFIVSALSRSNEFDIVKSTTEYVDGSLLKGLLVFIALLFVILCSIIPYLLALRAIRLRKYGSTAFVMSSVPGAIGGTFSGTIETNLRSVPEHGFSLELTCSEMWPPGDRPTHVVWNKKEEVASSYVEKGPSGIAIPVLFDIPADARETEEPSSGSRTAWHLTVSTDRRDGDYECIFEVPVFRQKKA